MVGKFGHGETDRLVIIEDLPDDFKILGASGFVKRDANRVFINRTEIHPVDFGGFQDFSDGLSGQTNTERIEIILSGNFVAEFGQAGGESLGQCMDTLRNLLQSFRPVIDGVKRGHVGQQRLRGADVAGGFLAPDVLLACAERQAQRRFAARIFGDADDAAWHLAFKFIACGEECGMRSSVTQWHAKTLGTADGDVRAEFAGRLYERERQQIRGDGEHGTGGVGFFREAGIIMNRAERIRILHECAENFVVEHKGLVTAHHHFDLQRRGAAADDFDGLRMAYFGDEEKIPTILEPGTHRHGFGGGGGFVEQ